jgi:membrane fusion protein, multidrug efflux system
MTSSDPYEGDTAREKRPTFLKGLVFLIILILVAGGLVFAALQLRSAEGPKVATVAPEPLVVSVLPVRLASEFKIDESYSGLAEARRKSQLGFSTGGRIEAISADVGDRVKQGATLARLDTRSLAAQLASAQATVEEARASHSLALNTVERQRTLKAQGHVSQQRVDEAEAQASTSMARIEAAKAQADTLRVQIDLARITAPFDGVVTARMSDEGAIAAPGTPILELVESGHLEARIGLPSVSAIRLTPGDIYTLVADTGPVDAKLRTVTGVIDADRRTVAAMFDIENPGTLPAGSVVRLSMEREIDEPGFWVPVKAMSTASRGLWTVFVAAPVDGGGWRAEPRPVEMVHSEGGRGFVRGPVQEGDRVIVDGLQRITPGMPVTPRDPALADAPNGG